MPGSLEASKLELTSELACLDWMCSLPSALFLVTDYGESLQSLNEQSLEGFPSGAL